MTKTKLVLFDMDGVLVLSEPLQYQSWFMLADELGLPMDDFMSFEESIGVSENVVAQQLVKKHNLSCPASEVVEIKRKYFLQQVMEDGIEAPAGRKEFLEYCKQRYKIGLVSSSSFQTVKGVLEASGLESYFSFLVTGDDVIQHKPDPEPYLLALNITNINADETVAIEDSENGVKAAQKAGITVLEFKTDFNDLMSNYADLI